MHPHQTRYVTACQQLLALAAVLVALVPAASVVSLDVVGESPTSGMTQPHGAGRGAVLGARAAVSRPRSGGPQTGVERVAD